MPGHIRGGQIWGTHPRNRSGGADGIRTHDLLDAIEARSQLRHGPTGKYNAPFYSTRAQRASTRASRAIIPSSLQQRFVPSRNISEADFVAKGGGTARLGHRIGPSGGQGHGKPFGQKK